MKERVIEDLLTVLTSEFLAEPVTLVERQMTIQGRRLDLLFEDDAGRLLLMELKRGELGREHLGQAGEYFGLLREAFPDREVRVMLVGTACSEERRRWLEHIGVEVLVLPIEKLTEVAVAHGVDPIEGMPREVAMPGSRSAHVFSGDRVPVTDESNYFDLIGQISDGGVKDRLAVVYGAARSNPHVAITFKARGSAEFSLTNRQGVTGKLLKVGVSFKSDPPKGKITHYWEFMLRVFDPAAVATYAHKLDELLGRSKADRFLDPEDSAGRFDTLNLHDPDILPGDRFAEFLSEFKRFAERITD